MPIRWPAGARRIDALFTPYTGGPPALSSTPFSTTGCPAPLPFSLAQSTASSSASAGAYTSYTLNLAREHGQQYLSQVKTMLPAGLLGAIGSVALCGEPQAAQGTCSSASRIGTATVTVGAGPEPLGFSGAVYLTGPYNGAPYGLSIAVPASAGPFDLGSGACDCVLTRAALNVDPYTARVVATSALPTIVKGVPLRLRSVSVAVNRPNFLFNPTSCAPLAPTRRSPRRSAPTRRCRAPSRRAAAAHSRSSPPSRSPPPPMPRGRAARACA